MSDVFGIAVAKHLTAIFFESGAMPVSIKSRLDLETMTTNHLHITKTFSPKAILISCQLSLKKKNFQSKRSRLGARIPIWKWLELSGLYVAEIQLGISSDMINFQKWAQRTSKKFQIWNFEIFIYF